MENNDFTTTVAVNKPADAVLSALTVGITKWWTHDFTGSADKAGDAFTVRFDKTFMTFTVESANENEVKWQCTDANTDAPGLDVKDEWIGTSILWQIEPVANGTQVTLTHYGLSPEVECYEICRAGWHQFTASFVSLLNTGKGMPF